jgi:Mlc titration factor MtfA (ptsG expression regulator)
VRADGPRAVTWRRRKGRPALEARYDGVMKRLLRLLCRPFRKAATTAPEFDLALIRAVCRRRVPFYRLLPANDRNGLERLTQRFLSSKRFWASGDITLTVEMKIVIAAHACLLVLHLPEFGLYPRTSEVIVYPGCFGEEVEAVGPDGTRYVIKERFAGRAIQRGPVLLAWDMVGSGLQGLRDNVIIHEFAHALDFLDGVVDGTPPLAGKTEAKDWAQVFTREFERLRSASNSGRRTLLDPYGSRNPAEFFAVVTDCFFARPRELRAHHSELYEQLAAFYRQDPANWPW